MTKLEFFIPKADKFNKLRIDYLGQKVEFKAGSFYKGIVRLYHYTLFNIEDFK